ncbi:MAG: amino acid ABC transporter substrate-binding protein [Desulfobacteraceae bacterium]|nr:amino acid ABC transporter substrate-binding protein [Desulfobacteraceae bacterium]
MNKYVTFSGLATAAALFLMVILYGCDKPEPLKIGFSGCLTGRLSDLGTAGRNGAILAMEQVNRTGGIRGRPVELIVKDDKHDPETAVAVDRELMDLGVAAIIGHMTSSMTLAALPQINREKMVMVGATASTDELSGIDDYFFRVIGSNTARVYLMADYVASRTDAKTVVCLFDLGNRSFSWPWFVGFKEQFEKYHGCRVVPINFSSTKDVSHEDLVDEILEANPQGLLLVASALHTAIVCQQLRKKGSKIPVFSSEWAQTGELLLQGGRAVEGMVFFHFFDQNSRKNRYLGFRDDYLEAFGEEPGFAAMCSYDAATLLISALQRADNSANLKKTILDHRIVEGLQGDFELDLQGDAKRNHYRIMVRDGRFVTVE